MNREPLIMVCTCDMAGRVRGKGFPAVDLPSRMRRGVGWVPTNTMISAFGPIYSTPFGTGGDLILVPDAAAEVNVDFGGEGAREHFFLGDIRELDGTPWACCPRDFLRRGLAALKAETGLELVSAFEHEFVYTERERDAVLEAGLAAGKKINKDDGIQRYKGLGEMDAKELWETTMDPAARLLRQITLDDAAAADELFSILMGDDVEARRSFITRNAKDVRFLDV